MVRTANLSHMTITGWETRYSEILKEFGYSRKSDTESAKRLGFILKNNYPLKNLRKLIENQVVFVVGAGPSLKNSVSFIKKYNYITKIVADGAVKALIEKKIKPDILVTDLDGDTISLKKIGKTKSIMVVHAHGDNLEKLDLVTKFRNCIGTTQGKSFGKIFNFGGFTDGDRCVFLAHYFKAKKIVLFGMDFGTTIGMYSKNRVPNRKTKLKKLRKGKKLLEWLVSKNSLDLYTTSRSINGFKKIHYADIKNIL